MVARVRQLERAGAIRWRLWDPAEAKPWLLKGIAEQPLSGTIVLQSLLQTLGVACVMSGNIDEARALLIRGSSSRLVRGMVALCVAIGRTRDPFLKQVFRMQLRRAREKGKSTFFLVRTFAACQRGAGTRQRITRGTSRNSW